MLTCRLRHGYLLREWRFSIYPFWHTDGAGGGVHPNKKDRYPRDAKRPTGLYVDQIPSESPPQGDRGIRGRTRIRRPFDRYRPEAILLRKWRVVAHPDFKPEMDALPDDERKQLQASVVLLSQEGPELGRPHADTLTGSKYRNLKELRFETKNGVWRVAYRFDPERKAILLCAGNKLGKRGKHEDRFYRDLIRTAEARLDAGS